MAGFRWTPNRTEAAELVAEGSLSGVQIAAKLGIARQTLDKWKCEPEFRARVHQHIEALADETNYEGIARRQQRISALHERWLKCREVITARANDPTMQDVPGGTTGLLVRQLKSIGVGRQNQTVEEYVVDTGLLAEMRAIEQQAAKEVGQWTERHDHKWVLEREAERLAREIGVEAEELIDEAERIIAAGRG